MRLRASLLTLPLAAACATAQGFPPDDAIREAMDAPNRFETPVEPVSPNLCLSPLRDPAYGDELVLVRSAGGRGDYRVPPDRYGARGGELLRVDCASYKPMGFVPG